MDIKSIENIISVERLGPYLKRHNNNFNLAVQHYKANIDISKAFYPLLSILEIGLRNSVNNQLVRKFAFQELYHDPDFVRIVTRFQLEKISDAKKAIKKGNKQITQGRIISELSFGFWTSLFDSRFERSLWKNLRLSFPNCPKKIRKRKTISSKLNGIRKLRNRIFHHEAITWDLTVLMNYRDEIIQVIDWLDKFLIDWCSDIFDLAETIELKKKIIEGR